MSTSLSFAQALTQAEAAARSTLAPALHERLSCAVALLQSGQVFQADDGQTWEVASTTTPGLTYSVNGACGCADAHFRPGAYCKHQLAVFLCRKVLKLMQAPAVPLDATTPAQVVGHPAAQEPVPQAVPEAVSTASTAPLPEAAFSLTLKGTLDGQEVLVTARGQTAAEFKANLEAIRGLLDPVPLPPGEGWCRTHGVQMTLNQKDGRSWWSHKIATGWCKGRS